jgi:hypothetical protein
VTIWRRLSISAAKSRKRPITRPTRGEFQLLPTGAAKECLAG